MSYIITSQLLESTPTIHAFSTRNGGYSEYPYDTLNLGLNVNDDRLLVKKNLETFKELIVNKYNISKQSAKFRWITVTQVHGNEITILNEKTILDNTDEEISRTASDSIITNLENIIIGVRTADCIPILIYTPSAVAAVHAGWKGTFLEIATKTINKIIELYSVNTNDIKVVIGPSIKYCCYEVDINFIDMFRKKFIEPTIKIDNFIATKNNGNQDNKTYIDLAGINHSLIKDTGVLDKNIEHINICTHCNYLDFFSHRRDKGETGRMLNIIGKYS